jgi:hypothetical protein
MSMSAALCAAAQTDTGQISGYVRDASGKPVAAALVRASARDTGVTRETKSAASGFYLFSALPPGEYMVSTTAPGLSTTTTVNVHAGQDFVLGPELRALPNLTRDPYRFAELAGNVSDAGLGTRGVGLAINGQRESSTNVVVDGIENRDEFTGSVGQPFPLDSILELSVVSSGMTAEYGRASGGVVNVVGRRGGNSLHGSAYVFDRDSALASNSFLNNSNGTAKAGFHRDQFGAAVGGPAIRNRLFYFANAEGTLVRSQASTYAWIPTPQLLAQSAANTQSFFQALGQTRPGLQVLGTVSLAQLTATYGKSPCTGLVCGTLPASLPLFSHVAYQAPGDAGAGLPQNTLDSYNRLDYNYSSATRYYARYGLYDEHDQSGALSNSPYANYDLSQKQTDNSVLIGLSHEWNSRWISQTTLAFDRIRIDQQGLTSRGLVPSMYANPLSPVTIGADSVAFPGYNPFSPGSGGAFGGPENILQLSHATGWRKGNHLFRFGGDYIYIRDNRTDAAYQTAVDSLSNGGGLGAALVGLLYGEFAQIQVAVNPQGQFPCGQTPTCSVNLPLSSPNFSRSNRFQEGDAWLQDDWHLSRRISVNLGVRWDHFGVQHNANPNLDSNWYAPGASSADSNLIRYLVFGGLQLASKSPVGGLYRPEWKDFAPRVAAAWDIFGDGNTVIRAGYGIAYDRNFGNVNFNVIQNLPNYAVLNVPGSVTTSNFGPLAGTSGSIALPPPGARIIDPNLRTAYAHFWNASAQRQIARGAVYSLEYSGSKGVDLYSVSYPNQAGFRNVYFGDPCTGNGDCRTQPNPYYSEDVGYRGNQGFSNYYGLNNRVAVTNLLHTGVNLNASYTWSHAVDNLSSTFFEAGGQVANRYGDRNITVNNGLFDAGLLDPFQPNLDRGSSEFDIRHRVTLSGSWSFHGWTLAPLFLARSGQPFSVFDTNAQTLDLNAPRATLTQSAPTGRNSFVPSTTPDTFHIITFLPAQITHEPNPLTPGSQWPADMSKRDAFRAPGFWNFDLALYKDTKLSENLALQLRAELFNVFNHANLYVIGSSANVGAGNTVDACFGCTGSSYDRRQVQLAARFSF